MPDRIARPSVKESGLVQAVRAAYRANFAEAQAVVVACSGGRDSVALTWLLAELHRLGVLKLSIAHVHHGQHAAADAAVEAVQRLGQILSVPVDVRQLDPDRVALHQGVGLEEALRRERYVALAGVCRSRSSRVLAVAHHQQDQAETLLLHVLRGAGIDGLTGMRQLEQRRIPWWDHGQAADEVALWRPLLQVLPLALDRIIADAHLEVVEDPTNIDPSFRRNDIRGRLLPLMEEIAPGSTAAIARSALVIAADREIVDQATTDAFALAFEHGNLRTAPLLTMPPALQARVIRRWLADAGLVGDITSDRINAIVVATNRNRGNAKIEVSRGWSVILRHGLLQIEFDSPPNKNEVSTR